MSDIIFPKTEYALKYVAGQRGPKQNILNNQLNSPLTQRKKKKNQETYRGLRCSEKLNQSVKKIKSGNLDKIS